ncbi:hypothetical protein LNO10_12640 [Klebsiella variicola subsp. variicola]|nr:hypothetical protein [Klebsiella variicola subsp. variicola]
MAFEYESKTPQDVLAYTDSPIFHKREVILDLAADVTCGDVINPTTGAAYVAADADNCAVALQNQIAGEARSLVISDTQCVFNPAGLVVAAAAKMLLTPPLLSKATALLTQTPLSNQGEITI